MSRIFQAGGSFIKSRPTYVERQADIDALNEALNGEYLHIIAPRQEGKTSLLKRLAAKLGKRGWRCAYVDLSIFMRLRLPTWYTKLGRELAKRLTPNYSPALIDQIDLRNYLLDEALPWVGGEPNIALFFDEVEGAGKARDADGESFSDSFFMVLRTLYNQRDDYEGTIVVVLAGAVNPQSLIKDPDISPFNVGKEIGLNDFTPAETRKLTGHLADLGLPVDEAVYQTIYEWTNGHPYLTQCICAELEKMARSGQISTMTPHEVVRVIEQVILNPANPLQRDKNLKHVAKMLENLSRPATQLWSRLRAGEALSLTKATYGLYLELYLTSIITQEGQYLVIRNRIYEEAFLQKAVSPAILAPLEPTGKVIDKQIRVFVSSTWKDLQPEREAVEKALHRMRRTTFVGMEYTGSRPETPKEVSLTEVERCDVYIGIFAHWYGEGITESESRRAREQGIPCLIYFKDESVPIIPAYMEREPSKSAALSALKNELKAQHTVSLFTSPDSLAMQVVADLHNRFENVPTQAEKPKLRETTYKINITHSQGIAIGDAAQVTQTLLSEGE